MLLGCSLTTQQRSTKGTPVNRFLDREPFLLTLDSRTNETSIDRFVLNTITRFGGIRRGITISNEAAKNLNRLSNGLWKDAEKWFEHLKEQRSREPQTADKNLEREAAHWADEEFAGLGPKQSRNLWQWLGLTRFEIPLDGRVTKWVNVNKNLTLKIETKRLGRLSYYESVLDQLQAICQRAGVLPCELDAAAFDYEDLGQGNGVNRIKTTEPGFVNTLGQVTIRNTGNLGTDHNQYVYQLACSHCGAVYGANGSDIHERKCPFCQGGRPGLRLGAA